MTELNTGTDKLLGRVNGPVAVLSFNRPESRNALSDEIYDGFNTALPQVAQRDDIRVLMVTGEGGAFCSGGDVKGFRASHAGEGESMTPEVGDVYGQFMAYFIPMALGGVLMFIVSWVISFSICYWGIVSWREHRMKKRQKKQHMEHTT